MMSFEHEATKRMYFSNGENPHSFPSSLPLVRELEGEPHGMSGIRVQYSKVPGLERKRRHQTCVCERSIVVASARLLYSLLLPLAGKMREEEDMIMRRAEGGRDAHLPLL